jgi:hypothetical protein
LIYGEPHIETKISLFIEIILLFIVAIIISSLAVTMAKKWNIISFSKVFKSNLALYGTLLCVFIMSFFLQLYIINFSRKNDLSEKIFYILFFVILFVIQAIIFLYFLSLVYILINYFPQDSYDKYLTHSKIYTYFPTQNTKTLLDNSILKIDSANSKIDYYSNKITFEKDLTFTIYFTYQSKEDLPFNFKVLDSTNEFGGSSSQIKYKDLYLKKLNDSIKIILQGVNFKNNIGWDNPRNTDTIVFVKRKTTIKKYP